MNIQCLHLVLLQRPLLVGASATAASAAAILLRKLDGEAVGLFYLYYQPLIPAVAMLWAWAAAVGMFEARAIKYDVCFSQRDQQRLLPASALYQVCADELDTSFAPTVEPSRKLLPVRGTPSMIVVSHSAGQQRLHTAITLCQVSTKH